MLNRRLLTLAVATATLPLLLTGCNSGSSPQKDLPTSRSTASLTHGGSPVAVSPSTSAPTSPTSTSASSGSVFDHSVPGVNIRVGLRASQIASVLGCKSTYAKEDTAPYARDAVVCVGSPNGDLEIDTFPSMAALTQSIQYLDKQRAGYWFESGPNWLITLHAYKYNPLAGQASSLMENVKNIIGGGVSISG